MSDSEEIKKYEEEVREEVELTKSGADVNEDNEVSEQSADFLVVDIVHYLFIIDFLLKLCVMCY